MSSPISRLRTRLTITAKTLAQFGAEPIALYGLYRFGLATGHYRRVTPAFEIPSPDKFDPGAALPIHDVLLAPSPADLRQVMGDPSQAVLLEADEIVSGSARLFGGQPVPLVLEPSADLQPLQHWTAYESGKRHWLAGQDIKFIWEPARFGWVFPLARAYRLTAEERYAQTFWDCAERFIRANPPSLGPQWASGQEVALRLIALAFGAQLFRTASATTPQRLAWLGKVLEAHARRIPVTLVYARSQQNNHLISEAAGLITAAATLPTSAEAPRWHESGLRWFNQAVLTQVGRDGAYIQHSTNYHRLMLQVALWTAAVLATQGQRLPDEVGQRLRLAAGWLADRLDPPSGRVPNLGHNDGAFIIPLSAGEYGDYRPVVQAATLAFCGSKPLPPGAWDEEALWLVNTTNHETAQAPSPQARPSPSTIIRSRHSWAELRAVTYHERPAHADQLHVDLWWQGINVAQDAGTYLYNAPAPWDNALGATRVHNTVEIDGRDQMTRAGRFRWVDWAQAQVSSAQADPTIAGQRVIASQNGYAQLGAIHRRTLETTQADAWKITDEILPTEAFHPRQHALRLHWLLPDLPWQWQDHQLLLTHPNGTVALYIAAEAGRPSIPLAFKVSIARCGQILLGEGEPDPILGWVSPTYGQRLPALSLSIHTHTQIPMRFISAWSFHPG